MDSSAIEPVIILLLAGIAMCLFSIPIMVIYTILEDAHKKKRIRKYARQQIIKQMEHEKKMQNNMEVNLQEKIDLHSDWN